jgi:hypothetical protein
LLALISGTIFIPSLELACGVWSSSSKLFEILYITIWYLGPLDNLPALDYIGSYENGHPEYFVPFSIALIGFAVLAGQVR